MYSLELNNVDKSFGNKRIIKNVSFNIVAKEVFGLLGPNGAGKTTLIKIITGLLSLDKGSVLIAGIDITKNRVEALQNVGAIVEYPEFYTYMSGMQNLMQYARIFRINSKKEINKIVELVGLTERINDKVSKYSLGMKQRLGIAIALLNKPRLLILDEPTNGLDPSGVLEFRQIIKKLVEENEMSVLMSTHNLNEVEKICDKVAFINSGEIVEVEYINKYTISLEERYIQLIGGGRFDQNTDKE